jgi:hypothetical protein
MEKGGDGTPVTVIVSVKDAFPGNNGWIKYLERRGGTTVKELEAEATAALTAALENTLSLWKEICMLPNDKTIIYSQKTARPARRALETAPAYQPTVATIIKTGGLSATSIGEEIRKASITIHRFDHTHLDLVLVADTFELDFEDFLGEKFRIETEAIIPYKSSPHLFGRNPRLGAFKPERDGVRDEAGKFLTSFRNILEISESLRGHSLDKETTIDYLWSTTTSLMKEIARSFGIPDVTVVLVKDVQHPAEQIKQEAQEGVVLPGKEDTSSSLLHMLIDPRYKWAFGVSFRRDNGLPTSACRSMPDMNL